MLFAKAPLISRIAALAVAMTLMLAGCDGDAGKGAPPSIDAGAGKADILDRVDERGPLAFGGSRAGTLTMDGEYHAYRVSARAGARITFDNSNGGTARDLDSVLYLFGPGTDTGFGSEALAVDDDSGWGRHGRIQDFVVEIAGEYLLVIGTFDGRGRGKYRVTAECGEGECDFVPLPTLASACHAAILTDIETCVDGLTVNADPEEGPMPVADAIAMCSDAEPIADAHDAICADEGAPSFCTLDYEQFTYHMVPVCMGEVAFAHRANVLGLKAETTDDSLADLAAAGCGLGCTLTIRTFTYPSFMVGTLEGVVGSVWPSLSLKAGEEAEAALHLLVPNEDVATLAIVDVAQALTNQPHPPTEIADVKVVDEMAAEGTFSYDATVIALLQARIVVLVERRYGSN